MRIGLFIEGFGLLGLLSTSVPESVHPWKVLHTPSEHFFREEMREHSSFFRCDEDLVWTDHIEMKNGKIECYDLGDEVFAVYSSVFGKVDTCSVLFPRFSGYGPNFLRIEALSRCSTLLRAVKEKGKPYRALKKYYDIGIRPPKY